MRYDLVDDVSCRNGVLLVAVRPALRLAAGVWTTPVAIEDSVSEARLECLKYAVGVLNANWPEWDLWLVAGHETLQEDNRITRYNGLWKSLQKSGVVVPRGELIDEFVLQSEGGLRVFGAVRFDFSQMKAVHAVMTSAQAAIVFMPKSEAKDTVSLLVRRGWPTRNTKPPEEILEVVCARSGLVVDCYGGFDDPDVAVAAIGKKEVFLNLNSEL